MRPHLDSTESRAFIEDKKCRDTSLQSGGSSGASHSRQGELRTASRENRSVDLCHECEPCHAKGTTNNHLGGEGN